MKKNISYQEGIEIANKYIEMFSPYCVDGKCVVAGSLRRKKEDIGDIELCMYPKSQVQLDIFGEAVGVVYPLHNFILSHFKDYHYIRSGERLKSIQLEQTQLDLFIIFPPAQWGYRLAITTGPAEYSKWLVTHRHKGGALPSNCMCVDGAILRAGKTIPMPREEDFFELLDIPYPAPEDRKVPDYWAPF